MAMVEQAILLSIVSTMPGIYSSDIQ